MQRPSKDRSRGRWAVVSLLVVFAVGITAAFLMDLRKQHSSEGAPGAPSALPTARSGYRNRGFWEGGPAARSKGRPKVTGTIYDTGGHPLEGARISATTFQMAGNQGSVIGAVESDNVGHFELALPDGTYYLGASKKGYGPAIAMAHAGEEVGIVLRKSGVVDGHVRDERGQPVTDFRIDVIGPGADDMAAAAPFSMRSFEGPEGAYRVEEIPRQGVFLRASARGFAPAVSELVSVGEGQTKTVDLTLSRGCEMKGIVTDAGGTPLAEVFVDAELRRASGVIGDTSVDAQTQGESDETGRFRLTNVPVGEVVVRAYDGAHSVTSVEVQIDACDKIGEVVIQMAEGSTLSGLVKTSAGAPVPFAKLTLSHRSTGFVDTMSDEEGRYHFDKLPSGGLRVEAQAAGQRVMAMVMMNPGQKARQDIVLPATGKGEIRGKITASGKPMSGVQLIVASNAGGGSMGMQRPVTGPDGSYRVTDLADGLYVVIVGSTGQLAQAKVESGSAQTVDMDVAVTEERGKLPEVPSREERRAKDKAEEPAPAPAEEPAPKEPAPKEPAPKEPAPKEAQEPAGSPDPKGEGEPDSAEAP